MHLLGLAAICPARRPSPCRRDWVLATTCYWLPTTGYLLLAPCYLLLATCYLPLGLMFWFSLKKFVGSYLFFSSTMRE